MFAIVCVCVCEVGGALHTFSNLRVFSYPCPQYVRLGWKVLPNKNTLAYSFWMSGTNEFF
jgi:hypothetical protein